MTWQPAEGTDDIASYRIEVNDNGAGWALWIASTTATSGSYSGQDGHAYQFRSIARDNAGNVESKSTNDSWTIVDMSPPDSVVTTLPPFENTVQFTVSWGPVGGTTDIATYQVQVREGAGAWVDLACCSSTTSASTSYVGQDGHSYGFRSIARDRAGNIEIAPPGNDTSTTVDIRSPFVTDVAPLGANTNLTPWVIVTFSEPMDRNSVALAFSITPAMNGAYQWSADSTQLTFIPARALNAGTTYAITVDSSADPDGLRLALRSTAPDGICTSTAIYFAEQPSLPLLEMYTKGITFRTGRVHAREAIPHVLELAAARAIEPERITTRVVPWADADAALAECDWTKLVIERS